jgi:hypothetical protein
MLINGLTKELAHLAMYRYLEPSHLPVLYVNCFVQYSTGQFGTNLKYHIPCRELKNKSTGIDIIVPEFQVIPGKLVNTVLYHVIVITRLFYFKSRQHKESDLVQFVVSI